MRNITPVNAFTDPVTVLENGDPVDQAESQPTIQALANRTYWLQLRQTMTSETQTGDGSSPFDLVSGDSEIHVVSFPNIASALSTIRSVGYKDSLGATLPRGTKRTFILENTSTSGTAPVSITHSGSPPANYAAISTPHKAAVNSVAMLGDGLGISTSPLVIRLVLDTGPVWRLIDIPCTGIGYASHINTAGSGQANAGVIQNSCDMVLNAVLFGTGDRKFSALHASMSGTLWNKSGGSINLYPPVGGVLNALAANTAIAIGNNTIWNWVGSASGTIFYVTQVA